MADDNAIRSIVQQLIAGQAPPSQPAMGSMMMPPAQAQPYFGLSGAFPPRALNTSLPLAPATSNMLAAHQDMNLSPQEQALYQRHLSNLTGPGGVDNPDGSRSTLYQSVQEHNGKFYNVPTVWGGKIETQPYTRPDGTVIDVPNPTALDNVTKAGWETFPSYPTPDAADARYDQMHGYMEKDTADYMKQRQN